MLRPACIYLLAGILLAVPIAASAQWQEEGLQIPEPGHSVDAYVIPDGQGGMIYTYERAVGNVGNIYAQRVDGRGNLLWGPQGVAVCEQEPGDQDVPDIVSDGQGGAYVVWRDDRMPTYTTIYAQHLNAGGAISYAADGMALVTGSGFDVGPPEISATPDGDAVVVFRLEIGSSYQLRAQKLDPQGYAWAYGGVIVHTTSMYIMQYDVGVMRDGTTCAVFLDDVPTLNDEVLGIGLDPSGASLWGPVTVLSGSEDERLSDVVVDEYGGLYVAGTSHRIVTMRVVLNRVEADGTTADDEGVNVAEAASGRGDVRLAPAPDGVWVGWYDGRRQPDIGLYVQRYSRQLAPQLTANGHMVFEDRGSRWVHDMEADGEGGVFMSWHDERWSQDEDVFVQKIDTAGDELWGSGGLCLRANDGASGGGMLVADGAGGLLTVFSENVTTEDYDLFLQRVERNGHWGYPAPEILGVADVPADQGGQVSLTFEASRLDAWPDLGIDTYTLWRAVPEGAKIAPQQDWQDWQDRLGVGEVAGPVIRPAAPGDKTLAWFLVGTVDALQLPGYGQTVTTDADSTGTDPADRLYQVVAQGAGVGETWYSTTTSGRSVDNLAPASPEYLRGTADHQAGGMALDWRPVAAPDLAHYAVHRGTHAGFVPGPATLVAAVPDTAYFDASWDLGDHWHYKVAAVDVHGNAGAPAYLGPGQASAVEDGAPPLRTVLHGASPNPFNPQTVIRYELAAPGRVRLRVHDAAGRLVRTLVDERQEPGRRTVAWDGRDAAGRRLASGVYLCRLATPTRTLTRRLTLLK